MQLKSFIIVISITFLHVSLSFARAGGGSGGGGNSFRAIGVIIGLINLLLITIFIHRKNKKAKENIELSQELDPLWNYDEMTNFTSDVFMRMQHAWSERDMDLVKDIVTERLYLDFKKQLDWMKVKREQNLLEDIELKKVEIIGDEDYLDNELDRFTVYIKGKMIDYKISDKTMKIIENKSKKKKAFLDLYYFTRHENKWLLDKIDNQVSLSKVIKSKQVIDLT